jgi:SMODS-associating 2TM, beta-strand rich effector domain
MNFNLKNYKAGIFIPFIVILAAGLTILHQSFLAPVISTIKSEQAKMIVEFIGILSVPGLLGLTLAIIDKWLWRFLPFLVSVPKISGRYEGKLVSTFDDPVTSAKKEMLLVLEIKQTASRLFISSFIGEAGGKVSSTSKSVFSDITQGEDGFYTLTYGYENQGSLTNEKLTAHRGLAELKFFPKEKQLSGQYFSQRAVKGEIDVAHKAKELKGKF